MVNAKFTDITESHNTLDPDLASCGAEAQTGNGAAGTSSARRAEGNPFVLPSRPPNKRAWTGHADKGDDLFQFSFCIIQLVSIL